jgi:hypothetical protein
MAEAWSGDGRYVLPAKRVEPYRLWFEFLKAAFRDPDIDVNKRLYKEWGDVEDQTFDEWWGGATWRNLFAVDLGNGVEVLEKGLGAPQSDHLLTVTLPLNRDPKQTLSDVQALLEDYQAQQPTSDKRLKGKFALTEGSVQGFEKRMNAARCMLRLYGYWLDHSALSKKHQVEEAALAYWKWSEDWSNQIRTKKWNRPLPYFQQAFKTYGEYILAARAGEKELGGQIAHGDFNKHGEGTNAEDSRRMVVRYIRKARNLATNVGRGEFPGKY